MQSRMRSLLLSFVIAAVAAACASAETVVHQQVDQAPQPVRTPPPEYPALLKTEKVSGMVLLDVVVNDQGTVDSAEVLNATNDAFIAPTVAAVKNWRFKPATKDGANVSVRIKLPVKFNPAG